MNVDDHVAIMNVLADYSTAFDRCDWAKLDQVFDESSTWTPAVGPEITGGRAIAEFFREIEPSRQPADLHQFFNVHLDEVDRDTVRSTSNWIFHARHTPTAPWEVAAVGSYDDLLVRGRDGWRIRHRTIHDFDHSDPRGASPALGPTADTPVGRPHGTVLEHPREAHS